MSITFDSRSFLNVAGFLFQMALKFMQSNEPLNLPTEHFHFEPETLPEINFQKVK